MIYGFMEVNPWKIECKISDILEYDMKCFIT